MMSYVFSFGYYFVSFYYFASNTFTNLAFDVLYAHTDILVFSFFFIWFFSILVFAFDLYICLSLVSWKI